MTSPGDRVPAASDTVTVDICGFVPISVGDRVEVRIYLKPTLSGKLKPSVREPLVIDLDTGVVYGRPWHFRDPGQEGMFRPLAFQTDPRAELVIHEQFIGRVMACRIVDAGESAETRLTLCR